MTETDEYISNNSDGTFMDSMTMSTAYQKMKSLCNNIRNEVLTDIEIHNQHILPRYFSSLNHDVGVHKSNPESHSCMKCNVFPCSFY